MFIDCVLRALEVSWLYVTLIAIVFIIIIIIIIIANNSLLLLLLLLLLNLDDYDHL